MKPAAYIGIGILIGLCIGLIFSKIVDAMADVSVKKELIRNGEKEE